MIINLDNLLENLLSTNGLSPQFFRPIRDRGS